MDKNTGVTDLTQGSVLKKLIIFAIPMILTNLLQTLYGLVDTYVVSRYIGTGGVSALNNGFQIMFMITNMIVGLSLGGNITIGQYFGKGDKKSQDEMTGTFLILFAILGVAFTALFMLLSPHILRAMSTPPEAMEQAVAYLTTCSAGVFFMFAYNCLTAIMRAVGNTRKPFHFIVAATITNLVLDFLFVGALNMNTFGAALATVLAQGLAFVLAFIYLLRQRDIFIFSRENLKLRMGEVLLILRIGVPTAVQMTIAGLSFAIVAYFINGYGVIVSAANGLSGKIRDICLMFVHSMMGVTTSMIAQNLGAGKYDRARDVLFTAIKFTFCITAVIVVIMEFTAPALLSVFRAEPAVTEAAVYNLRIEIIAQLFYAIFMVQHALMTGAGHTMIVLGSSFVNCILFRAVLAAVFNHFFGLTGVYAALALAPASSIPIGYIYYKSNIWRKTMASGD